MIPHGLEYIISLNNQLSEPLKAIKGELDRIGEAGKEAMVKIGAGVAGIMATAAALHNTLAPALEMDRSLGDLNSLNVTAKGIEQVKDKALELSSAIGASSVEIAKGAYDVKKALGGISDIELAEANNAIYLLGAVTKGNAQAANAYVGVMHGIFNKEAKAIGEARWVENLVSKTEHATVMFNASVQDFQAGFATLGNSAQRFGHATEEQIAVMGLLTKLTGSGGAAGGKYNKVIKSAEKAQKELGLSFYDSAGNMNDLLTMLTKIKGKYGNAIPEAKLIKAFGNDAGATVSYMLKHFNDLKQSVRELENVNGVGVLRQKAIDATDGFLRLSSALENIKIAIGTEVLKKLYPIIDYIADLAKSFGDWLTTYKNIARWIGYLVGGLIALTAIVPAIMLIVGLFKLWGVAVAALFAPFKILGGFVAGGLISPFGAFFKLIFMGFGIALKVILVTFKGLLTLLNPLKLLCVAFKLAFSPFVLWLGLFAFIYKFRAELSVFFEGVVKGFNDWGVSIEPIKQALGRVWGKIQGIITKISEVLGFSQQGSNDFSRWTKAGEVLGAVLAATFQVVVDILAIGIDLIGIFGETIGEVIGIALKMWQDFFLAMTTGEITQAIKVVWEGIANIFTRVLRGVKNMFFTFLNWLIDKVNGIGQYIGIKLPKIKVDVEQAVKSHSAGFGVADFALQMAHSTGAVSLTPKRDSNGQVFSLGTAQPPKLEKSPQISKTMNSTQNIYNNTTIHKIETKDGKDTLRVLKEQEALK